METRAIGVQRRCFGVCVITDGELYTSLAESVDPASAVEFINRYFEVVFRPVFAHGGFVSDVKGDGMLAVWADGSPPDELRRLACRACLHIAESASQFRHERFAGALRTRVGACFGPLALATVGTAAHHEYRAVGDTVNTSSRLEQLNKALGTRILVCASLAQGLDEFVFRDLGPFELRGKANRVHVHELVATREASSSRQRSLCSDFAPALGAYQQGRLGEAFERFQDLGARYPGDGPTRFYLRRCLDAIADCGGPMPRLLRPVPKAVGL